MKHTLLTRTLALILVLLPMAVMQPVYAACGNTPAAQQVFEGIDQTSTPSTPNCDDSAVTNTIYAVVNILSTIVGIVAVVVIIISGFKYITSGGDSGKVGNAKNSLIYAIIGLIIAALAQLLVYFVLNQATTAACPPGSTDPNCAAPAKTPTPAKT